ncbi:MAG: sensor domain-containing diguanylate cyclase [Acidimicrobiales bacterium]
MRGGKRAEEIGEAIDDARVDLRDLVGPVLLAILVIEASSIVLVDAVSPDVPALAQVAVDLGIVFAVSIPLLWLIVGRAIGRRLARERRVAAEKDEALRAEIETRRDHQRMTRAVEIADDEAGVLDVVARATVEVMGDAPAELLLADSSDAHLRRAMTTGSAVPGCGVRSPRECIAVRHGRPLRFSSSERIDACPRLRGRELGACSAACVPLTVLSKSVGVLHVVGPEHEPPSAADTERLGFLMAQTGNRLGMIRALADSQLQASTDPLTGLVNRRTFDEAATKLAERGRSFAVVMADLDHFKDLNDTYGHSTGDRALRLFASVLRRSVRTEEDVVARHGGEEFVLLLPGSGRAAALEVAERIRTELSAALGDGSLPIFTTSLGVADSTDAASVAGVVAAADEALYAAKTSGRDRVVGYDAEPSRAEPGVSDAAETEIRVDQGGGDPPGSPATRRVAGPSPVTQPA